jgi:hypothetical protein
LPSARIWQQAVEETWELINVASEDHNFHIHQTKFRVVLPSPADSSEAGALVDTYLFTTVARRATDCFLVRWRMLCQARSGKDPVFAAWRLCLSLPHIGSMKMEE